MNEWYGLVNDLETEVPELDELSRKRIDMAIRTGTGMRRPRWKLAAVVAVLVLLTACGVVAVRYADWFESLIDPAAPTASEDLLAAIGTPIRQQQTVDGVTIQLHGALYDGHTCLLSLSVEGLPEEGRYSSSVDPGKSWLYYSREDYERHWSGDVQYSESYDQIVESIGSYIGLTRQFDLDSCLLLLEPWFKVEEGRELTLHLEDLSVMGQVLEGPFVFRFTLEKKDNSCTYSGSIPLTTFSGEPYKLTEVVVTPLEIRASICGTMDEQGQPPESTPVIEEVQLATEGWTWSPKSGAWIHRGEDDTWEGVLTFGTLDRIIDPAAVSAIRIDETWVELSQLVKKP